MPIIGDQFNTGDGLTLSVSLVLLEIPNEGWIKSSLIAAFHAMTLQNNWYEHGDITPEQAAQIASLLLQTIQFDYEPPDMTPVGIMSEFGGSVAPAGWLLCNGAAISRSAYSALFAALGTAYGIGNGTTTFNLPDMRDRSPMMPGTGIVTALGQQAGAATVALAINNLPSHDHDYADPGHFHDHIRAGGTGTGYTNITGATAINPVNVAWPTQSKVTGITFHAQGNNIGHANLHPVLGVNVIIFAGV